MHFRIQTDIFRKAIEATSHATSSSNLTPILENILIEAQTEKIILTGNNLDMAIEYVIEEWIEIYSTGKFTLSSKFLSSYIALVQDTEVIFELEWSTNATLSTTSGKTKLKWIDAEKFPSIPSLPDVEPITLPANDFRGAIEKTNFSTADGSVRPMLAWIYMHSTEEKLIFASTDSFRLSDYQIYSENLHNHSPIIIPKKTAIELWRLITEDIEFIKIFAHEAQMFIHIGVIRLTSRLLSGRFPDYQAFFPKEYQTRTTILRTDFINAIKQVNLVSRENNYNTRIRSLEEWKIEIFTGDTEIGASTRTLSATVEWQPDTIGINSEYLLAVLNVIRDDYVSFEYKNPLSPIVIHGVADDNKKQYRHLIMPLKI